MTVNTIPVRLKLAAEGRPMTVARFQKAIENYDGGTLAFHDSAPGIAEGQIGVNGSVVSGSICPLAIGNTGLTLVYNGQPVAAFSVTVLSGKSGTLTISAADVTIG